MIIASVTKQEYLRSALYILKSAGSQSICNGFARSLKSKPPLGYMQKHTDFCTLFGDVSANLLPFIEECLAFISWHFLTPQAADFVRDTTMSVAWLLAGQFRSCAQGGTKSSS